MNIIYIHKETAPNYYFGSLIDFVFILLRAMLQTRKIGSSYIFAEAMLTLNPIRGFVSRLVRRPCVVFALLRRKERAALETM